jgi:dihydrofolate reductase
MRPTFTLLVVATEDGFIARHPSHSPAEWASPEEQAHFFAEVGAADWSVMGRHTHEAADRPDRRRIVFSSRAGAPDWRRPSQLWLDPKGHAPDDLAALVAPVRHLRHGLILGGTRVHDWFHAAERIDRVLLTVEPLRFGTGLPVFSGETGPADAIFARLGYGLTETRTLNATGTRLCSFAAR